MSAANCPEGKRGPSGALGAAQSDPQGGWEASRATGRELCDTGHPVLEDSPEGATAGRSPRPREAEGRLAPEMAESHEARSQAQAQRRAWSQCIATWAASGVAVPLAFFCTLFFRHRKKSVSAPWDGQSQSAPESARQTLIGKRGLAPAGAPKGFPRGKQSARPALPCAPLVVCLNSGALTAFGGCAHWARASLCSPLETFGHRKSARSP